MVTTRRTENRKDAPKKRLPQEGGRVTRSSMVIQGFTALNQQSNEPVSKKVTNC